MPPLNAGAFLRFTRLKVLVVVGVLGLIVAMLIPNMLCACGGMANKDNAKILVANVQKASEIWTLKRGTYPQSVEDLLKRPTAAEIPLLDRAPLDAWGSPIRLQSPNPLTGAQEPLVWSVGANRIDEQGHGDDIFYARNSSSETQ